MNTGQYISGAGHLALIAYMIFGGMFLTPENTESVDVQEVDMISEAEFAAMSATSTAPETFSEAPTLRAPAAETAPKPKPVEDIKPEVQSSEAPPPDAPESPPEVSEALPAPVVVDPTPPSPQSEPDVSLEDPGANLPSPPDRKPTPRPVPRIADQAVTAPEPQPEIADAPVEATSDTAESEKVVEQPKEKAAPQETTTEIVTEAEKPAGMSTSARPKTRPANLAAEAAQAKEAQKVAETPKPETPKAEPAKTTPKPDAPKATPKPETPKEDASDAVANAAAEGRRRFGGRGCGRARRTQTPGWSAIDGRRTRRFARGCVAMLERRCNVYGCHALQNHCRVLDERRWHTASGLHLVATLRGGLRGWRRKRL